MVDNKLLTTKDLAERWQVGERTINEYKAQGVIVPVKGIPCVRYNPQYIAELEGIKLGKFSPYERRRLEREIEELKQENTLLKQSWLSNVFSESANIAPLIK